MNLKEQIENYEPYNEQEKNDKEIMLSLINRYDDVLTRENKVCHFTASNWIVNKERTKILWHIIIFIILGHGQADIVMVMQIY